MPPAQVRPDEVTPLQGRPRVLVVDDDAGIRLVCATTLALDGCHAIEAANGQEALELALAEPPDLVLLDLSMPVLDGFGLAAALRADERTRDVPLVILTGESVLHLTKTIDATGALGFFTKPFDPAAISAFIRNVLTGYPNSSRSASVGA